MNIRPARADEYELLLGIQRAAAVAAYSHVFPPSEYPFPDDAVREAWRATLANPELEVYIAEASGEPVGTYSVGASWLRTLYVIPEHWGRGTGSALHDHGLGRLAELGFTEARLWTLTENHIARRFYEKRGWTATGETRVVEFPPYPLDVEYTKPLPG